MKAYSIYGPPGTGKTTELVKRVNKLMDEYHSNDVAMLSYTRSAAEEMSNKLNRPDRIIPKFVCTIHSLCYQSLDLDRSQVVNKQLLDQFGKEIGISFLLTPSRTKYMTSTKTAGDRMLETMHLSRDTMSSISDVVMKSSPEDKVFPMDINVFEKLYTEWKKINGFVDFTDMLSLMKSQLDLGDIDIRIKALVVDEAQDLSKLQWAVLMAMPHVEVMHIAGDDDQSIFMWAGAHPRGMVEFDEKYNSDRTILNQTYRFGPQIHDISQKLIKTVINRVDKDFMPLDSMNSTVDVKAHIPIKWMEIKIGQYDVILYRDITARRAIVSRLKELKIPYYIKGCRSSSPLKNTLGRSIRLWRDIKEGLVEVDEKSDKIKNYIHENRRKVPIWELELKDFKLSNPDYQYYNSINYKDPMLEVCSIHRAKGQEWDRVLLIHHYGGRIQRERKMSIEKSEAEKRVWYVGITRAKKTLDILKPRVIL